MSCEWIVGKPIVYSFECRNARTNELIDPDPCMVSIIRGDGSEDTVVFQDVPEAGKLLVRNSVGSYTLTYLLTVVGEHRIRAAGTWSSGGVSWSEKSCREFVFTVNPDLHTYTDIPA